MSRRLEAAVCRRPVASGSCGRGDDRPGGCGQRQDELLAAVDDEPDPEPDEPEPDDVEPDDPEPDDPEPDDPEPDDPDDDVPDDDDPEPDPPEDPPEDPDDPDPPADGGTVEDLLDDARESVR